MNDNVEDAMAAEQLLLSVLNPPTVLAIAKLMLLVTLHCYTLICVGEKDGGGVGSEIFQDSQELSLHSDYFRHCAKNHIKETF